MSRITVITAGHLSTCPRMLKAAESLSADGHDVRVVSTNFVEWGRVADSDLRARLQLPWNVIDYSRTSGNGLRVCSGIRFHACRALAKTIGPERLSQRLLGRAATRIFDELVGEIADAPADLIYGGGGALVATAEAARRLRAPFAIDLEDFHGEEHSPSEPDGVFSNQLAKAAERVVFREATLLTTASDAIADRYRDTYGKRPLVINNTFALPKRAPEFVPIDGSGLRLYWFSQTIGPGRGIEDAINAAGLAAIRCELHLRGNPLGGYLDRLHSTAREKAPQLKLVHHPPEPPDRMVDLCRDYHVGLALELDAPPNRAICLTNKAFTYILAGLAVVFTDTPGQRKMAEDLGAGAFMYHPGDVEALAQAFKRWAVNPEALLDARKSAWEAAQRRWHWEHELEEGALLRAVRSVLR